MCAYSRQMFLFKALLPLVSLVLANCATITHGTSQELFNETPKVQNASCDLQDEEGAGYRLAKSPGSVTVRRGNGILSIVCVKDGYESGILRVEDEFSDAIMGNVIMPGGSIGLLIDAASGAARKYPENIAVWMAPLHWASEAERNDWQKLREDYFKARAEVERQRTAALNDRECC